VFTHLKSIALMFILLLSFSLFATNASWRPEVMDAIKDMIAKQPAGGDRPVAVFDWDNTVAKHDVSDAVFLKMLAKNMIFAPPNDDLREVNALFTQEAISAVKNNCKRMTREKKLGYLLPGSFYVTSGSKAKACRQQMLHFYHDEKTVEGQAAFDQSPSAFNRRTIKPSYLWVTQLLAGLSRADVYALTNEVLDERTTAEAKARRTERIDDFVAPSFLEIYDPMVELMDLLLRNRFEVWIVSASQQYVVETFAARLDRKLQGRFFAQSGRNYLETENARQHLHVVGVQVLSESGDNARAILQKLGLRYQGNGPVLINKVRGCGLEGENEIITYIDGKTCFIDLAIRKRPLFAAGDATTDVSMLQSATALSVVINRNYDELMCNAYQGTLANGKQWMVQPMFIDPCPKREQGYQCHYTNEVGESLMTAVDDSVFVVDGGGKLDLDCHR
jgi:hypothetical protein